MSLIQTISSTLKTWVFKKKLLKFSEKFRRDPQACFFCPEMCRFACPMAETLRSNVVTPRGKMSLLHLAERGFSAEKIAGSAEQREWVLEQCTGCGRCTEFCVHEIDVASNLRGERALYFAARGGGGEQAASRWDRLKALSGTVLLCEPGRREWWLARPKLLEELGVEPAAVCDVELPHRDWGWGKLSDAETSAVGAALEQCRQIWVESPEAAWFLAKGVKNDREALRAEVRAVWQGFFGETVAHQFGPDTVFHESWHLTRHFPRLGYSMPMYERGFLPFHNAWNAWDCGGEGYFKHAHPDTAREMAGRFLYDIVKDGRLVEKIVCQSAACVEHLRGSTQVPVTYWLDEIGG